MLCHQDLPSVDPEEAGQGGCDPGPVCQGPKVLWVSIGLQPLTWLHLGHAEILWPSASPIVHAGNWGARWGLLETYWGAAPCHPGPHPAPLRPTVRLEPKCLTPMELLGIEAQELT